jgi:hypothetical protein
MFWKHGGDFMTLASMRSFILVSGALVAHAQFADGAQPPDVVVTDQNGNTAMGSYALFGLTTGVENTAAEKIPLAVRPQDQGTQPSATRRA